MLKYFENWEGKISVWRDWEASWPFHVFLWNWLSASTASTASEDSKNT